LFHVAPLYRERTGAARRHFPRLLSEAAQRHHAARAGTAPIPRALPNARPWFHAHVWVERECVVTCGRKDFSGLVPLPALGRKETGNGNPGASSGIMFACQPEPFGLAQATPCVVPQIDRVAPLRVRAIGFARPRFVPNRFKPRASRVSIVAAKRRAARLSLLASTCAIKATMRGGAVLAVNPWMRPYRTISRFRGPNGTIPKCARKYRQIKYPWPHPFNLSHLKVLTDSQSSLISVTSK
jgi:hypothetical protein